MDVPIRPKGIEEFLHREGQCALTSGACVIHNPSDHKMNTWPIIIRETALAERECPHGIGHPDPDSLEWLASVTRYPENIPYLGMHGCDGCCRE